MEQNGIFMGFLFSDNTIWSWIKKTGDPCVQSNPLRCVAFFWSKDGWTLLYPDACWCGLAKLPGGLMIYLQAIADVNHMGMGQFTLYNRSLIESIRISSIEKFVSPLFLFVCRWRQPSETTMLIGMTPDVKHCNNKLPSAMWNEW